MNDNHIGTDDTGSVDLGNAGSGIVITPILSQPSTQTTFDNTISNNLVSGNDAYGIDLFQSDDNLFVGNKVGTDASGTADLGNVRDGIRVFQANNNIIGGTSTGSKNVFSGNDDSGIHITSAPGTLVQGNFVGVDITGTVALGNDEYGVNVVGSNGVLVGGTTTEARNIISGNGFVFRFKHGVCICQTSNFNTVAGNYIGTDVTGTTALGNAQGGVLISNSANNLVGGNTAAARNVISANFEGVRIQALSNQVAGNFIGTDASGSEPLGNSRDGVVLSGNGSNTIGGSSPGDGNTIAFNGWSGVIISATAESNSVLSNHIFSNGRLGIDLGREFALSNGVTDNDLGDGDGGANRQQNFPVLVSAVSSGGATTIDGTLNSVPSSQFRIEFFSNTTLDPSNFGEGENFLGSAIVATDANGDVAFSVTLPVSVAGGQFITSTATLLPLAPSIVSGDTSEFSGGVIVIEPTADLAITKTDDVDPVTVGDNVTYTITVTNNGPDDATGVMVSDSLPAEVSFVSASAGCTEGPIGVVTCSLGALADGASTVVSITVTAVSPGLAVDQVLAINTETDPDPANSSVTEETTIVAPPTGDDDSSDDDSEDSDDGSSDDDGSGDDVSSDDDDSASSDDNSDDDSGSDDDSSASDDDSNSNDDQRGRRRQPGRR